VVLVESRLPQIQAEVEEELAEVGYLTRPDGSLVRKYCYIVAQTRLMEEWFEANGGMFTTRGGPKRSANFYLSLVRQQMELAKVLGLGAVPRAQVARDMAGAGRDVAEVRAAQERLRLRQLRVLSSPE
jgi:phage terminase small subunit